MGIPSTNNGLESLNGKIKQIYTLRSKLPLSSFLPTIVSMLQDWSHQSVNSGFTTYPSIDTAAEAQAWKWSQGVDKNAIVHCYQHSSRELNSQQN
ncbi:unnamed protein product [Didymodactylos carnosus]|uniref:Uncharacterized protein n=1 Tax=Didymodactylos carnosus TaxID=1234261 RepID=A0A815CVZ5_9BILA|nr:unnamed protein product [Didymodactylos carnosus]CAF1293062.1 unnamed protein product [Didymodactylos carnosus]CAF3916114.1 unnamed protein product [Didymodactylos carnosus]CAF4102312.1 unnamed protein product [Didymodactylos carnosus]